MIRALKRSKKKSRVDISRFSVPIVRLDFASSFRTHLWDADGAQANIYTSFDTFLDETNESIPRYH